MNDINTNFLQDRTGDHSTDGDSKIIIYPFDRFNIKVMVGENKEFLGITEVAVNKDFMSYSQKIAQAGYHDVEKYYKD